MYSYHEHYHDAYAAGSEDLRSPERCDDTACEPIRMPAIVNWLVITGAALLGIVAAIHALS